MTIAWALLILRVTTGGLLIGHGSQKLFGWFGGPGLNNSIGLMQKLGFKPASFWALLGGVGEFGGGLLLALGFLGPLGAIGVFGAMLMAIVKFHWSKGLWGSKGGFEYPLVLLILSFVLGLAGSGHYALDTLFHIALPIAPLFWLGIIGAAIVDGIGIYISDESTRAQARAASHTA